MVRVGVISGSGADTWPGLLEPEEDTITTRHGEVTVTRGQVGGAQLVHLPRHGAGHARLSNHVTHRANVAALHQEQVDAIVSLTVCGAVDESVPLGSLTVFDDLYFPQNRLPDGSLCTWFDQPGGPGRGHWIMQGPFSEPVRRALIDAAGAQGITCRAQGSYGHVDGPRFNTRTEIAALSSFGVTAISQTAGPEVVLAGEAQIPLALVGFVTDYANGVSREPEPVDALLERMTLSRTVFADLIAAALPLLAQAAHDDGIEPAGLVHRFDP